MSPISFFSAELDSIKGIAAAVPFAARQAWIDQLAKNLRGLEAPYGEGLVYKAAVSAAKLIAPKGRAAAPTITGRD